MTDNAIEIVNLHKGYRHHEAVVDGLTMSVPTGSIYGFIGKNGSGKSTTLNTLMGLLKPWSGTVKILGQDAWGLSAATKARIAYVPEVSFHFPWLNIRESMAYVAKFYPNWDQRKADALLSDLEFDDKKNISDLSLGQTRAISIVTAICCNPDLLILDEPSGNLDVVVRRLLQQYILDFAQQPGKTVLISSHVLTDLERLVDRVGIVLKGQLAVEDELDNLKENTRRLRLFYDGEVPRHFDIPNILFTEFFGNEVRITLNELDEQSLPRYACIAAAKKLEIQSMDLEDIFVAYSLSKSSLRNKRLQQVAS